MRLHFPHISRIFTARKISGVGSLVLWIALLTLVSFNISVWISKPLAHSDNILQILAQPFSASAHDDLTRLLLSSGARIRANQELALVAELSPVLGASTKKEAAREEEALLYWQNALTSHPDYRDAYVQLAALTYREGNEVQAHRYLVQAQNLDPNNEVINQLVAFTSKVLE